MENSFKQENDLQLMCNAFIDPFQVQGTEKFLQQISGKSFRRLVNIFALIVIGTCLHKVFNLKCN